MPPIPDLPPSHSFQNAPLSNPNPNPNLNPNLPPAYYQNQQQQTRIPEFKNEASFYKHNPDDYISSPTMSSRGPRIKSDPSSSMSMSMAQLPTAPPQQTYKNPNPLNIEIKTKFPVARIKRIMQADEEVGKVAQVTPVAVSKALELFMISLVSSAADVAKEKGQKRVTAQHLKAVVLGAPEQFDFLAEIVGRVSEAQEGAGGEAKKRKGVEKEKEKAESESSEEEKKPKKGRGRRKKSAD
jgi:histone H3/H4